MATPAALPDEEVTRLQRCINDLISVLAFPAMWSGRSPPQIVDSFLDGLGRMLQLDLAYVQLSDETGAQTETFRVLDGAKVDLHDAGALFRTLGDDLSSWPRQIRFGANAPPLSIESLRLGLEAGEGMVVVAARRSHFPLQTEKLLLNVAASQLRLALQEAQLRLEQKRMAEAADQQVAERTAELASANAALRKEISERRSMEARLRDSEALLLEAQRLSHTGSFKHDPASSLITVSPELARILGLAAVAQTMPVGVFFERIHPEDKQRELENFATALRDARGFDSTYKLSLPDGSTRHIRGRCHPQVNEAGHAVGLLGVAMDVTEQQDVHTALQKAFDEIQKSEAKLRQVLDTIPNIAWCNLPTGPNEYLNRAWREYTGHAPEDSQGWGWQSAMHPDDLPPLLTRWGELMVTGEPGEIEARLRRHDGVYRWFLIRTEPFRDETGQIARWYGTSTDIDDRKRAEEALLASQREFIQIVNLVPALVWSARPDGSAEFFSDSYLAYVGMTPDELLPWGWMQIVHPDDLPALVAVWEAVRGAPRPGETEARLRRFDGEYRWFLFRANPVLDDTGKVVKWYGINTDIDDRKRAEDRLRRSEAFLAEGQNLARIGNFAWLTTTNEMKWSEQLYRIFEFEPDTPVSLERFASLIHPEDRGLLDEMIGAARQAASDVEYSCRLLTQNGAIKYLDLVAHATRDSQGRLEYIGAVQDVTPRRAADEALNAAKSELANIARMTSLGVLTAAIAHEVNQPISGIITNATTCLRMLSAQPPNIDGARETARRTIRDGNRASDVIVRLRNLYTRKGVAPEAMDLNEAAQEVISLWLSELQRNGVVLRNELAESLPPIKGDRIQLQQVILNLLRNASDAMRAVHDRPRDLVVRTASDGTDRVRLSVIDTGTGFSAQDAERIFEPFHTTKSDGMGIGLSVSRSIIEAHYGRLWATPNEGPGVTFAFSLPVHSTDVAAE